MSVDETTDIHQSASNEPTVRIDPETGNKVISLERNGETLEFIIGSSPEGTDIRQRVPYDADDYGPVADFATDRARLQRG